MWSFINIIGECLIVMLKKLENLQKVVFIHCVFTFTAGKMENAMAHQRDILDIQKPVEVLIYSRPRTIYFKKIGVLSRDPVLYFSLATCKSTGQVKKLPSL
jgi:hypothetical protein